MVINNELVIDSLLYQDGRCLTARMDEMEQLDRVSSYCKELEEKIQYDADLFWELEVEPGEQLVNIIYGGAPVKSEDGRRFLQEMITKKWTAREEREADAHIYCSLGTHVGAADNMTAYCEERQQILQSIKDAKQYTEFMRSCFPNSVFAEGCDEEFLHIKDFGVHKEEITNCLKVLDQRAIALYEQYQDNLKEAMDCLTRELCTCAPDPKHEKDLLFTFCYEEEENGEKIARTKEVVCSPHLKLIRDDSDLRIYFYWKDAEIEAGKKVLIGRVGRHPWSKYK